MPPLLKRLAFIASLLVVFPLLILLLHKGILSLTAFNIADAMQKQLCDVTQACRLIEFLAVAGLVSIVIGSLALICIWIYRTILFFNHS